LLYQIHLSENRLAGLALWKILFLWVTAQLDPDISRQHGIHICTGQDVQEEWQQQ